MSVAVPVPRTVEPALVGVLTRARLPLFVRLLGIGVAQACASIATALLIHHGYRSMTRSGTGSSAPLVLFALGLTALVLCSAALRAAERVAAERLGQHYATQVRAQMFAHLTTVPARLLGERNRGSMLLRFVGDVSALRSWVSLGLAKLLVGATAVTLALTWLIWTDPRVGVAVALVLVGGAAATLACTPRLVATGRSARRTRSKLTGEVSERLMHVAVLQAAGQARRERGRVGRLSDRTSSAMIDRARAAGRTRAVAEATAGLAAAAVVVAGIVDVRSGSASAGSVLAALIVVGLLAGHIRDLGRVAEYASGAAVARAAARRFLALPSLTQIRRAPALAVDGGRIEFDGVTVSGALDTVTATAEPGQRVAIVGANGAGKSTLVGLAARLADPEAGRVLIDGQELRTCSIASVRAAVGVAAPDLPLLRGTVERNVRYRSPRADDAEVQRVADLSGLTEVLEALPDGWRTDVGNAGSRLSSGQRARIALARAALDRPPVLVLDEAEAHLSGVTAAALDRVLAAHQGTALIVTHRPAVAARCDVVWCLQDGRLVEVGPPDVLLARDGPTARLFAAEAVPAAYCGPG
jgi:ATP-binding cassette, subfamily B, bacterial